MTPDPIQMALEALEKSYPYYEGSTPSPEYEEHHKATLALRQHQQAGGWLPISEAPKDGEILALIQGFDSKKFRRVVLSYDEFQEEWRFDGSAISNAWIIVGYQPLPPAPKKENDDERS